MLVDRGLRITLLESRPRLGGRASSFTDPVTGEQVDNCQHVSMACCTNLADFCRRVGIADPLSPRAGGRFPGPRGPGLAAPGRACPAPFHLAGSFLRGQLPEPAGQAARWLRPGLPGSRAGRPAGRVLRPVAARHRQSPRTIDLFWSTVLVSALNERLDQMDVGHARKVFVDGFLSTRTGFEMELPLVPLGDLYGSRLETWLRDHAVDVRLTTASARRLRRGRRLRAWSSGPENRSPPTSWSLAVSFDRVRRALPRGAVERIPELEDLDLLESSPITGVHLWFDRPVCPFDHVVTPGRLVQWVFNHTAIQGREPPRQSGRQGPGQQRDDGSQYLQIVISASYDLLAMDKRRSATRCLPTWPRSGPWQGRPGCCDGGS